MCPIRYFNYFRLAKEGNKEGESDGRGEKKWKKKKKKPRKGDVQNNSWMIHDPGSL